MANAKPWSSFLRSHATCMNKRSLYIDNSNLSLNRTIPVTHSDKRDSPPGPYSGARPRWRNNGIRPFQLTQPQHGRNQQPFVRNASSSSLSDVPPSPAGSGNTQIFGCDGDGDGDNDPTKQTGRQQRQKRMDGRWEEPDIGSDVNPLLGGDVSQIGVGDCATSSTAGATAGPLNPADCAGMNPARVALLTGSSGSSAQQQNNNAVITSQPQQGSSSFGTSNTNNQPQGGSLFGGGGVGQTNQRQQQGSLFGNTTQQQQPQPNSQIGGLFGGGSLFGGQNNQNSQQNQTTGGSPFSGPQNQQQTVQPGQQSGGGGGLSGGGSLFGGQQNQNNQQNQNAAVSLFGGGSSLFGGNQNQQQQKPMGSTFGGSTLFGGSNQTQNNRNTGCSVFGDNSQNPNNRQNTGGSFFGGGNQNQNQNNQQRPTNTLFGAVNQRPPPLQQPSLLAASQYGQTHFTGPFTGRLSMGQGNAPATQAVSATKLDWTNVRGTTRFVDLIDSAKEELENIDEMIRNQEDMCRQIEAFVPAHGAKIESLKPDVDIVREKADAAEAAMSADAQAVQSHKSITEKDARDLARCERIIYNNRLADQYKFSSLAGYNNYASQQLQTTAATPNPTSSTPHTDLYDRDLIANYFLPMASDIQKTLNTYSTNLAEIEGHMRVIEASAVAQAQQHAAKTAGVGTEGGAGTGEDTVRELADTLRGFEQSILGVAATVGGVREGVNDLVLGRLGGGGMSHRGEGTVRRPW